ncbi:MAG: diguanylate cyclase [Rhodobacteraceae bacterium]|nr:diguanylate cyclase [Paracoccaceae bacterium]
MTNRIIFKARLGAAGFCAAQAASGAELAGALQDAPPDLILLAAPFGGETSGTLCHRLRAHPATERTPIVLLSDDLGRGARIEARAAGADAVLPRQPDDVLLRARIGNLLRRHAAERELTQSEATSDVLALAEPALAGFRPPGQIAVIAPSLADGLKWRNALATRLRDRISVIDPEHAIKELGREQPPDAVVIADRPDRPGEAAQILSNLRCHSETLRSATVVVQMRPDPEHGVMALNLGVGDLVETGFDADEMTLILRRELRRKAQNDSRRAALQDGLRLASTDPLTGLFNRRYALGQLARIMRRAPQTGEEFAVMVLDLDRFKRINDNYGHAAGDEVLTEVSRRMQACLRRDDFLARIGGEEFLAVINACDLDAARVAAERLRHVVSKTPLELPDGKGQEYVTMSIGLVIGGEADMPDDPATLIDLADRGLYTAKAEGRNQVTVYRSAA